MQWHVKLLGEVEVAVETESLKTVTLMILIQEDILPIRTDCLQLLGYVSLDGTSLVACRPSQREREKRGKGRGDNFM